MDLALGNYIQNNKNNAKLKKVPSKSSPDLGENDGHFFDVEFPLQASKC
jgi:hypothetical protein